MRRQSQQHNLKKLYENEGKLDKYIRLTVGMQGRFIDLLWHEFVLGIGGMLPGLVGFGFRNLLYSVCFRGFSRGCFVGGHVTLRCPKQIKLSDRVIIDDYSQLIATSNCKDAILIGEGSFVRSYAMINSGPPNGFVRIGSNSSIGQGSILYGNGGLNIGDNVMVAGQCFIVASSHNYEESETPMVEQGITTQGIDIEDNVWIGAGAKILDGVSIGKGAVIGANAVVTKSVPKNAKVGGVPARIL